jgi:hypothetical protein
MRSFISGLLRMRKSRRMRWAVHIIQMEVKRTAYRLLVGKRPKHELVDNVWMDLDETGWDGMAGLVTPRTETIGRLL